MLLLTSGLPILQLSSELSQVDGRSSCWSPLQFISQAKPSFQPAPTISTFLLLFRYLLFILDFESVTELDRMWLTTQSYSSVQHDTGPDEERLSGLLGETSLGVTRICTLGCLINWDSILLGYQTTFLNFIHYGKLWKTFVNASWNQEALCFSLTTLPIKRKGKHE